MEFLQLDSRMSLINQFCSKSRVELEELRVITGDIKSSLLSTKNQTGRWTHPGSLPSAPVESGNSKHRLMRSSDYSRSSHIQQAKDNLVAGLSANSAHKNFGEGWGADLELDLYASKVFVSTVEFLPDQGIYIFVL
jgi:hypothetical protein